MSTLTSQLVRGGAQCHVWQARAPPVLAAKPPYGEIPGGPVKLAQLACTLEVHSLSSPCHDRRNGWLAFRTVNVQIQLAQLSARVY